MPNLHLRAPTGPLLPRQNGQNGQNQAGTGTTIQGTRITIIIAVVVVAALSLIVVFYIIVKAVAARRSLARKAQHASSSSAASTSSPQTSGNSFFKRIRRWRADSNRGEYSSQLQPIRSQSSQNGDALSRERSVDGPRDVDIEIASSSVRPGSTATSTPAAAASTTTTAAGVDRNASIRSIMTLPPYSIAAQPTERVLGREGERAGIDVVVSHPETIDEEEVRRDEEMESLYQIRRARRNEAQEREELRRQRREARARGDHETANRLQAESRTRARAQQEGVNMSSQLIAEHQNKNRDRRVSEVQYHEVGLARHDGSRVRGTSFDSDNRPLLSSAASIGGTSMRPDSISASAHRRGRSNSSARSSTSSDANARDDDDFEVVSLDNRSRASSVSPSFSMRTEDEADHQQHHPIPSDQPPQYDNLGWGEAPPYESPVQDRAPQLPALPSLPSLAPVPSIEITHVVSPISSPNPNTGR